MANDADMDFGDALNEWLRQVDAYVTLSAAERGEITEAGAKAYAEVLKEMTPRSDIDYSKGRHSAGHATKRKRGHLADSITYKGGFTADNLNTGDTDVGYDNHYFDFLARLISDGQKKMSAKELANTHFTDRAQEAAKERVYAAMKAKYDELHGGGST